MQTYVNSNNREIIQRIFYGVQLFIPVLLLRTLRFPEIRTCEMTDELGWVIITNLASRILRWLIDCFGGKIVYPCTEVMQLRCNWPIY